MKKSYKYGVVQGRLVPQVGSFIQSFPAEHWMTEIKIAERVGCSAIEWIATPEFGFINGKNPILGMTSNDFNYIKNKCHVDIDTLCLDEIPTLGILPIIENIVGRLQRLNVLGIRKIVLPLLECASVTLPSVHTNDVLIENLRKFIKMARQQEISISLETDLSCEELDLFVEELSKKTDTQVCVTLDTGNLLRLGYDPVAYAQKFGEKIDNIHIKDACLGGVSVPLGHGRGQLTHSKLSAILRHTACERLTFQTARMSENTDVETFKHNVAYVESAIEVGHNSNLHGIIW